MGRQISVGLIGASSFGKNHLAGFQASPHVRKIVLAGRNREALEALAREYGKVAAITTAYESLFTDPELDLVDIVLPHDMHLPVAAAALRAGKHVLVEKPPAR
ncbi:MAG: Gfo/Idh/MocA family oxidoreductase, partial [Armatimonadetes bacterium]|nr:Gfo/Idh/MocA family oxidoreductase [Armatimonadota bacterium]